MTTPPTVTAFAPLAMRPNTPNVTQTLQALAAPPHTITKARGSSSQPEAMSKETIYGASSAIA